MYYRLKKLIPSRAKEIKEKINKRDYIKLNGFCTTEETISQIKRKPSMWENIFANDTSGRGLSSKTYKEFIRLNTSETNSAIKK